MDKPHDQKLSKRKQVNFNTYQDCCPVRDCDDLEYIDGCLEYQELECSNKHIFTIDSLGWEISQIKEGG